MSPDSHSEPSVTSRVARLGHAALQELWRTLNERHFQGRLAPIDILWSARLTSSAGMFVSRVGPRTSRPSGPSGSRVIRLSSPLLEQQPLDEVTNTLAHEMIHQWQFDVLRRRPNHGPDFCRKMDEMNRVGLQITIHHSLDAAVQRLAKYTWRCRQCGRAYERQRRTIRPRHHRCGSCLGRLEEVRRRDESPSAETRRDLLADARALTAPPRPPLVPLQQLELTLGLF